MNYIKCPHCGGLTPTVLSRCRHCGEPITKDQCNEPQTILKDRNEFVSYWLFMGIFVNLVCSVFFFFHIFSPLGLFTAQPEPLFLKIYFFAVSLLVLGGYLMMWYWLKAGFSLLVGLGALGFIGYIIAGFPQYGVLFSVLPLVILYGVLQLKKGGRSCWSMLGASVPNQSEIAHSDRNSFITLWLYLGITGCIAMTLYCIALMFAVFNSEVDLPMRIFLVVYSLSWLMGYVMLCRRIRVGFYLIVGISVIFCMVNAQP